MTEHKLAEILRAIADGKAIQVLEDGVWYDKALYKESIVLFSDSTYRVKPESKKYRVFEYRGALTGKNYVSVVGSESEAKPVETSPHFCRWLTEWVEYEADGLDWRKIAHEV